MIKIENRSNVPIFEQIFLEVQKLIALKVLRPKDQLPTVRQLARELGVNPNTVSKAYHLCESNQLIESIPGKGFYVLEGSTAIDFAKSKLYHTIRDAIKHLNDLGDSTENIIKNMEEYENDTTH